MSIDSDFISITEDSLFTSIQLNNIEIISCDFDTSLYDIGIFKRYGVTFPDELKNAVVKLQAEFFAGRYIASLALEKLRVGFESIPIGKHRAPVWPEGVAASISHSAGKACCAVTCKHSSEYIGVYIEQWLDVKSIQSIESIIVTKNELIYLHQLSLDYKIALILVFSAKESLFKTIYPRVNFYFDFDAVEIISICTETKTFRLRLKVKLSNELDEGSLFSGVYFVNENLVGTLVAEDVC
ncbi:4'-phosphopantetheinyl transferase superfamily protein [Pseudoalteromonas sp. APC 3224]|uniref:4'-phosphopantetheinyl transferase family protein n=1 Tax=Pseudoalteromonas sp. APC 3224 TaxID=3035203 RepID=UPI0025B3523E|nr:4'-phosphopantetheinyl transferase superfamily protein [Pseudoalteromonas sp. APC 3224]MDN3487083.1 4'-phosphopantetheinyl transferase superfamily protein [Pseudoalteromonas sp. APC 3224]